MAKVLEFPTPSKSQAKQLKEYSLYQALPSDERWFLRLRALLIVPVPARTLFSWLPNRAAIPSLPVKCNKLDWLMTVEDSLTVKGLLTGEGVCHPAIAHQLRKEASQKENLRVNSITLNQFYQNSYYLRFETYFNQLFKRKNLPCMTLNSMEYCNIVKATISYYTKEPLRVTFGSADTANYFAIKLFLSDYLTDIQWLSALRAEQQVEILQFVCSKEDMPTDSQANIIAHYLKNFKTLDEFIQEILTHYYLSKGDIKTLSYILTNTPKENKHVISLVNSFFSFTKRDFNAVILQHEEALKVKSARHFKNAFLAGVPGVTYCLSLIVTQNIDNLKKALRYTRRVHINTLPPEMIAMHYLLEWLVNNKLPANNNLRILHESIDYYLPFASAICHWVTYHMKKSFYAEKDWTFAEGFKQYHKQCPLAACVFAGLLEKENKTDEQHEHYLKAHAALHWIPHITLPAKWQQTLSFMRHSLTDESKKTAHERIVWVVDFVKYSIEPFYQKVTKSGRWSKGRKIATYHEDILSKYPCATKQDLKALDTYNEDYYYDFGKEAFEQVLEQLVEHPYLLTSLEGEAITLSREKTACIVRRAGDNFQLSLSCHQQTEGVHIKKESPTSYKIFRVTQTLATLASFLGEGGMELPSDAKDELLETLKSLDHSIDIQSDFPLPDMETKEGICDTIAQLYPLDVGLKARLIVRPLGKFGPDYKPGKGGRVFVSHDQEKKVQVVRDLVKEKKQYQALINATPILKEIKPKGNQWEISEPDEALALVSQLQETQAMVEWPKKEQIKVHKLTAKSLSLKIKESTDWFALEGKFTQSDHQVFSIKQLLSLLETDDNQFIKLGDHEFLSLTSSLKKQLRAIKVLADDELRLPQHLAYTLEDLADEAQSLDSCDSWTQKIKNIKEIKAYKPKLPSNINASLRAYQQEGFAFLSRLAKLNLGACLADDMGLGKTLQALSLLQSRASEGPALVVAPTSLVFNWLSEAKKFTPQLQFCAIKDGINEPWEKAPSANQVVVVSYGLLIQKKLCAFLQQINWQTIILDEAQAIKNPLAKKTQAVMTLKAQFKMILTGTPIENHLTELWSLFRFIQPGLLGSLKSFEEKFVGKMTRATPDKSAEDALKALLKPFILRRKKSQVLTSLPPKIEKNIIVPMEKEEASFYEALRQHALEKIDGLSEDASQGNRRFEVLAQITKLRRACCSPQLIDKKFKFTSSKTKAFIHTLEELIANNHSTLVFSQFVAYLKHIADIITKKGICFQYLDGSTTKTKRQQQIDAFQSGKSQLFLLSLKAGGVGLNLTAADYVIHLDPWWNPAVETQATDRAHRIGQTKSVNVYRFITKNTIEEKILALHDEKRELSENLLSGNENAKLNEKALYDLMD